MMFPLSNWKNVVVTIPNLISIKGTNPRLGHDNRFSTRHIAANGIKRIAPRDSEGFCVPRIL